MGWKGQTGPDPATRALLAPRGVRADRLAGSGVPAGSGLIEGSLRTTQSGRARLIKGSLPPRDRGLRHQPVATCSCSATPPSGDSSQRATREPAPLRALAAVASGPTSSWHAQPGPGLAKLTATFRSWRRPATWPVRATGGPLTTAPQYAGVSVFKRRHGTARALNPAGRLADRARPHGAG